MPVTRERRRAIEHLSVSKRQYGLTTEQYVELYKDAVCQACGIGFSMVAGKEARLVIDHDHATGKIRGILCHECNMALGQAQDNPAILRAIADYIENYTLNGGPFDKEA